METNEMPPRFKVFDTAQVLVMLGAARQLDAMMKMVGTKGEVATTFEHAGYACLAVLCSHNGKLDAAICGVHKSIERAKQEIVQLIKDMAKRTDGQLFTCKAGEQPTQVMIQNAANN